TTCTCCRSGASWQRASRSRSSATPRSSRRTWERRRPVPLLEVRGLRTGYGHQPVLHGVDLTVHERETAVILGLNGAGKTTTLNTVAGLHRRWDGTMTYDGSTVDLRQDSTSLVPLGIVLVPEGRRVFPGLTVTNNLRLGAWAKRKDHGVVQQNMERAFEIFPRLAER